MVKKIDFVLYYGLFILAVAVPVSTVAANIIWPALLLLWIVKMAALKKVSVPSCPVVFFALILFMGYKFPFHYGRFGQTGLSFLTFFLVAGNTANFNHAKKIGYVLLISFALTVFGGFMLKYFSLEYSFCRQFYPAGDVFHPGRLTNLPGAELTAFILLLSAYLYYGFKKLRMVFGAERIFIAGCMLFLVGLLKYGPALYPCVGRGIPMTACLIMAITFYKSRAAFLDRDGTINDDMKYSADPDKLKLFSNAAAAIKMLNDAGFKVVIVTNQSGVARGCFSLEDVKRLNNLVVEELKKGHALINGIYVCPHHPDVSCSCRKPNTGMIKEAARDLNIDIENSYVVGDMKTDMLLAKNSGASGIFVLTGAEKTPPEYADYTAKDIYEAAAIIISRKDR